MRGTYNIHVLSVGSQGALFGDPPTLLCVQLHFDCDLYMIVLHRDKKQYTSPKRNVIRQESRVRRVVGRPSSCMTDACRVIPMLLLS